MIPFDTEWGGAKLRMPEHFQKNQLQCPECQKIGLVEINNWNSLKILCFFMFSALEGAAAKKSGARTLLFYRVFGAGVALDSPFPKIEKNLDQGMPGERFLEFRP